MIVMKTTKDQDIDDMEEFTLTSRYETYSLASGFDPGKVFFTSDTHFHHQNIIKFCGRPFRDAEDMNEELIRRWREKVPSGGVVFHLGDFGSGGGAQWTSILDRLTGKIILIVGNHDLKFLRQSVMARFGGVAQQMSIKIGSQAIYLNHYPFLCYGGAYRDTWQLYGHVHSGPLSKTGLDHPRLKMLFPLQYDVGVDNNDYAPISFYELKAKIEEQVRGARGDSSSGEGIGEGALAFLSIEGVLCHYGGERFVGAKEMLGSFCERTGARIVLLGCPLSLEEARAMPILSGLPVIGCTLPSMGVKEAIGTFLSSSGGGSHRYVTFTPFDVDDFRAVKTDSGVGLRKEDIEKAISLLK